MKSDTTNQISNRPIPILTHLSLRVLTFPLMTDWVVRVVMLLE